MAIATGTHPDLWMDTDDRILITVIDELEAQAERMKRG